MAGGRGSQASAGTPLVDQRARTQSRGRSPVRHGGRVVVVRESTREVGSGDVVWPMLTRTNYAQWSVVMMVNLQAKMLWDAVATGDAPVREDRSELAAILRSSQRRCTRRSPPRRRRR